MCSVVPTGTTIRIYIATTLTARGPIRNLAAKHFTAVPEAKMGHLYQQRNFQTLEGRERKFSYSFAVLKVMLKPRAVSRCNENTVSEAVSTYRH